MGNPTPKVSVVVPFFNTEAYLSCCLESIRRQDFRDFEAILVNDGSTDDSLSIARRFADGDSRFRLVSEENAGLSAARNLGIENSRGEWLTFVDSDDAISPHFLSALLSTAARFQTPLVASGKQSFEHFSPSVPSATPQRISSEKALLSSFYQRGVPDFSAWNKLFKRRLWERRRFPLGIFFEDMATIPDVFSEAGEIGVFPAPLYFYRKREGSILQSEYDLKKAGLLLVAEKTFEKFRDFSPDVHKAAGNLLLNASFSILMRTPETPEFRGIRERAFRWIREWRVRAIFDKRSRLRSKAASVLSFGGERILTHLLKRFG